MEGHRRSKSQVPRRDASCQKLVESFRKVSSNELTRPRIEHCLVDGSWGSFQGPASGQRSVPSQMLTSHKLHGHDPPHCHQEVAWGRVSPACSRRARRRTAPWLEPCFTERVESTHRFPKFDFSQKSRYASIRVSFFLRLVPFLTSFSTATEPLRR